MFKLFKRTTTVQRIADEIHDLEIKLLSNEFNADHFRALADGNKASIKRLKAMRDVLVTGDDTAVAQDGIVRAAKAPAKLRAAA